MNFGKYAILSSVKHDLEKEPDWWWMIHPPTSADELVIAKLLTTERVSIEDGDRVSTGPTSLEIALREVAVTFDGTNIPTSETDPTPILNKNASWPEVEMVLRSMPRDLVIELWYAVGEAVPGWGPKKPKN